MKAVYQEKDLSLNVSLSKRGTNDPSNYTGQMTFEDVSNTTWKKM